MIKQKPSKSCRTKPILSFVITMVFLSFFANNASARHTETRAGWAANGIASSLHNLSSSGPMLANGKIGYLATSGTFARSGKNAGTSEMCVYCHTPHFADRGKGPLWNRTNSVETIEAYGTTIAKNSDGNTNMFSTLACLSCHDGVTTFDSIINQPGKGTGNVQGLTGTNRWTFRMGQIVNGGATADHFSSDACVLCHGDGMPGPVGEDPALGFFDSEYKRLIIGEPDSPGLTGKADLTNDHPIGVIYRGAGDANASASLRARTVNISDINMDIETENGAPIPALVTGNLWAIKGFISNSATIQDLLRSGSGQGSGNYVQCTSCHDAHFKNQTNPEKWFYSQVRGYREGLLSSDAMVPVTSHQEYEVNGLFLRRVGGNSDSGLCRTCHDKG